MGTTTNVPVSKIKDDRLQFKNHDKIMHDWSCESLNSLKADIETKKEQQETVELRGKAMAHSYTLVIF